jgi:uncharacterized protein (AIM24 family)
MTAPSYRCRFCRLASDPSGTACPSCGAPVDVTAVVSRSGWQEQPPIQDMARIQFGRSTCQVEGTYVPAADFGLAGDDRIYFSHHSLLWCEPSVRISAMAMAGGWNRVRAGLPLVMLEAQGPGHLALSDDAPGDVVAIPLEPGQAIWVREHRFLVATATVGYTWEQSGVWITTGSGDDRETHYPLGMFVDSFHAEGGPGLLLLHSPGNTFIRDLAVGEAISVQPSSLLYKDPTVGMQLHLEYPNADASSYRWATGFAHVWLRLWGPGRVAVQSVFERPESNTSITGTSPATVTRW